MQLIGRHSKEFKRTSGTTHSGYMQFHWGERANRAEAEAFEPQTFNVFDSSSETLPTISEQFASWS